MLILFVILLFVIFIFDKKQGAIFKKKKLYKRAKCVNSFYLSKKLILNVFERTDKQFLSYNVLQQVDHIVSCVKFNNPTMYGIVPDYEILKNYGFIYPIFVVSSLTDFDIKCLSIAKKFCNFNIVIPQKLITQKNKLNFNYFILNNEINKKLYNNLMLLNINKNNYFKIIKPFNSKGLRFFYNNIELFFNNKIINNKLNYFFNNENINIIYEKIFYCGEIYKICISNKTNKIQKVKVLFNQTFNDINFLYKKIPYGINICAKNTNCNLLFSSKVKFNYSKSEQNFVTLPFVALSKNIKLLPQQNCSFVLSFGSNSNYKLLPQMLKDYSTKLESLLNVKIECDNKSLMYMFNIYLPNQIVLNNLTKAECNFSCYQEAYNSYKNGNISSYQFYVWLKNVYFGIRVNSKFVYVYPLYKENFNIKFTDSIIRVKKSNNDERYLQVNDIKFYNYSLIPINQLSNNDTITLVL